MVGRFLFFDIVLDDGCVMGKDRVYEIGEEVVWL
jgi:hypothetical protein